MECRAFLEQLPAWVEDNAPELDHATGCPRCASEELAHRRLLAGLARLRPQQLPSAGLLDRVRERVREEGVLVASRPLPKGRSGPGWLGVAAAALVCGLVGFVLSGALRPPADVVRHVPPPAAAPGAPDADRRVRPSESPVEPAEDFWQLAGMARPVQEEPDREGRGPATDSIWKVR